MPQVTNVFKLAASEKYSKPACNAPQICEIIKPINKSITLLFTFFEIANIKVVTKRLPAIAETTINALPIKKSENKYKEVFAKILMATINEAPELIPNTYGPAKGFLKIICKIKPAAESAQPAIMAVMVLGKRICQKIKLFDEKSDIFRLSLPPKNKLKKPAIKSKLINVENFIVVFFCKAYFLSLIHI